jgi:outer membrane protein assembly factor BamB
MSATPSGHTLVTDLANARLVWRSEDVTPAAPGSLYDSPRRGREAHQRRIGSGGTSPVVANGLVYLSYHVPAGDVFDESLLDLCKEPNQRIRAQFGEKELQREMRRWLIDADDVVVAMNAATGETVWKTVFERAGANFQQHKNSYSNQACAVAGDRLIVTGSTMRLFCLNAITGETLWQSDLGGKHQRLEQAKAEALTTTKKQLPAGVRGGFNRTNGGAPIVVENVVVSPNYDSGLRGHDLATGKLLWETTGIHGDNATPVTTELDGNNVVIASGRELIACLDPIDGRVLWKQAVPNRNTFTVGVRGDTLVTLTPHVHPHDKDPHRPQVICFDLSLNGATQRWAIDHPPGRGTNSQVPIILDQYVYVTGSDAGTAWKINAATGKVVAKGPGFGGNSVLTFAGEGRFFTIPDGKHGAVSISMHNMATMQQQGSELWQTPNPMTTSYHTPMSFPLVDGRLFVRGDNGVYCYDLRQKK